MALTTLKSWITTAEGIKMSESNRLFKNGMRPVHPGEILVDEIVELDMSPSQLADALAAPKCQVKAILQCDEHITTEMALRLSRYFGTTPELWMNLQKSFDLKVAEATVGDEIKKQVKPREGLPMLPEEREES